MIEPTRTDYIKSITDFMKGMDDSQIRRLYLMGQIIYVNNGGKGKRSSGK